MYWFTVCWPRAISFNAIVSFVKKFYITKCWTKNAGYQRSFSELNLKWTFQKTDFSLLWWCFCEQGRVQTLLFKNDLWVFVTKITAKLILNAAHHGRAVVKMLHSRSPKRAVLFYLLSCSKTSDMHLASEDF